MLDSQEVKVSGDVLLVQVDGPTQSQQHAVAAGVFHPRSKRPAGAAAAVWGEVPMAIELAVVLAVTRVPGRILVELHANPVALDPEVGRPNEAHLRPASHIQWRIISFLVLRATIGITR